jgi:hypothetical protein
MELSHLTQCVMSGSYFGGVPQGGVLSINAIKTQGAALVVHRRLCSGR